MRVEDERPVIGGPSWATFFVEERDRQGRLIAILGGTCNAVAARGLYDFFRAIRPHTEVVLCHGARIMARSSEAAR